MADRVEIGELSLACEEAGEGPAVVFVHGLGGRAPTWRAQLAACAEHGFRAIAYDQRGAGLSSKAPGPYSVERWARDLVELLDAMRIERAALVGHSVGCMIAEHAAVALGERCTRLVMIGGALRWRPEAAGVFAERVRLARSGRMDAIAEGVAVTGLSERCREQRPALHGLFVSLIAGNDPEAYAEWSEATAPAEMVETDRVGCPALAMCGEHDPVTPFDFAQAVVAAMPDARAAVVREAAHWCHLEAPEAVNRLLLAFLRDLATYDTNLAI